MFSTKLLVNNILSFFNNGIILFTSDVSEQLGKEQCFHVFCDLFFSLVSRDYKKLVL